MSTGERGVRRRYLAGVLGSAVLCGLLLLMPSLAIGDTVVFKYKGGVESCKAIGLHGAVDANAVHILTTGAAGAVGIGDNTDWKFDGNVGKVTETDKVANANNDKVEVDFDVQHLSAPHAGEPAPNPNKPALKFAIEAGKNGLTNNKNPITLKPLGNVVAHKDHFDWLVAGPANILVNANNQDFDRYDLLIVTRHAEKKDPPNEAKEGMASLTSATLPSSYFGTAFSVYAVDQPDTRFDLAISVAGASVAGLTSASIRQGTPSAPGPVILALNTSDFEDAGAQGMASRIDELIFPAAYVNDLNSGNTFVELVLSGGTLAGAIQVSDLVSTSIPAPAVSATGLIVLTLALLAAGWYIARKRAARPVG